MLVKTLKVNNVTARIHDDYIPKEKEEYKKKLETFYGVINILFKDKPELFYTQKELEKLKNNKTYEFI